jgi:hypothetical protein
MNELKPEFALIKILDYKRNLSSSQNAKDQNSQINYEIQTNLNTLTNITTEMILDK